MLPLAALSLLAAALALVGDWGANSGKTFLRYFLIPVVWLWQVVVYSVLSIGILYWDIYFYLYFDLAISAILHDPEGFGILVGMFRLAILLCIATLVAASIISYKKRYQIRQLYVQHVWFRLVMGVTFVVLAVVFYFWLEIYRATM